MRISKLKKKSLNALCICVFLIIFAIIMFFEGNQQPSYTTCTPQEILSSYEQKNSPFTNTYVRIKGNISNFGENRFEDSMFVTFKSEKEFNKCELRFYIQDQTTKDFLKNTKDGDSITLQGFCKGITYCDIIIENAQIPQHKN